MLREPATPASRAGRDFTLPCRGSTGVRELSLLGSDVRLQPGQTGRIASEGVGFADVAPHHVRRAVPRLLHDGAIRGPAGRGARRQPGAQ